MKGFACSRMLPAAALLAVGGCLLYTDDINHPPERAEILGPFGHSRNMPISFTASAFDPDDDPLTYEWAHKAGPCVDGDSMPPVEATGMMFQVIVTDFGPFCVWLKVTDSHGATTTMKPTPLTAMAANTAPIAMITRQQPGGNTLGPFPLYSDFRLSAAGSSDPDRDPLLSRVWSLAAFPDQSKAKLVDCAPTDPKDMADCFHADVKGDYRIALAVSDGLAMGQQSLTVTVADDAPPCLIAEGTDLPARVANPAEAQVFSVRVADDGDPWPAANPSYAEMGFPSFTWKIRQNGGPWQIVTGFNLPTLSLASGELSIGDRAEIRVEVADRVARSLATCGDDPACRLAPDCAQRLTWTVDFR